MPLQTTQIPACATSPANPARNCTGIPANSNESQAHSCAKQNLALLHHPSVQPFPDCAAYHAVSHPLVQKVPQLTPIHRPEEVLDVQVNHPASTEFHQPLPQRIERLVSSTPRPKPVRALQKVLLVHRLQHHQHRPLEDLVLQRRDANRAPLVRPRLVQVHPAHRRRSIPPGLEPFEQARQVRLPFGLVLRRRHSVHTRRRILAGSPVRFAQPHRIDVVRQRRQGQLRLSPSQLRYLALSR